MVKFGKIAFLYGWAFATLMLCFVTSPAQAYIEIVEDVVVQAEAESGLKAREKAFNQARRQAVREAYKRHNITLEDIKNSDAENATSFIEVLEEKVSDNYYAATLRLGVDTRVLNPRLWVPETEASPPPMGNEYNVPDEARQPPIEKPDWVLVVPIHKTPTGAVIWDPANPWVNVWQRPAQREIVDLITTSGDEDDRKILPAEEVTSIGPQNIRDLMDKYTAPAVALVMLNVNETEGSYGYQRSVLEIQYWQPITRLVRTRIRRPDYRRSFWSSSQPEFEEEARLETVFEPIVSRQQIHAPDMLAQARRVAEQGIMDIIERHVTPQPPSAGQPVDYSDYSSSSMDQVLSNLPQQAPSASYRQPDYRQPNYRQPDYRQPDIFNSRQPNNIRSGHQPYIQDRGVVYYPPQNSRMPTSPPGYQQQMQPAPQAPQQIPQQTTETFVTVPLTVQFNNLNGWLKIKRDLASIPGIMVSQKRISRNEADLMITYEGSLGQLHQELQKNKIPAKF